VALFDYEPRGCFLKHGAKALLRWGQVTNLWRGLRISPIPVDWKGGCGCDSGQTSFRNLHSQDQNKK
jgi:hypothetical protein